MHTNFIDFATRNVQLKKYLNSLNISSKTATTVCYIAMSYPMYIMQLQLESVTFSSP